MFTSNDVIETLGTRRESPRLRVGFLRFLGLIAVTVILGRSFYLQVWQGGAFLSRAENNRVALLPVPAPRGIMYDSRGVQLVENIASTDLVLDPQSLPPEDYEQVLMEELPGLVSVPVDEVRAAIWQARQSRQLTPLARTLDHETILRVEQTLDRLPGVRLISSLVRRYPRGGDLAHVTGYTSPITTEELEESPVLQPTDITGKTGLEKFYNTDLHGRHGARYVEVDAAGRPQHEVGSAPPVPGSDLHLTLDMEFQAYIASLLREQIEAAETDNAPATSGVAGAVVALDPRSGAIRALASYPTFDPNIFSQPMLNDQIVNVLKDEQHPLFTRVTSGAYPPGSTIKPLIAVAALEEDVVTPTTTYLSTGGITYGVWRFPDWKAGGHGITDIKKALAESVNTFFYLAAGGDDQRAGLGVERITRYLALFGWGASTGIDLPSETTGFLPSPAWKKATKNESWYIGDTYHLGIGQGDVLASPLQVTLGTAAIANGGMRHTPFVVRSVTPPTGEAREHTVTTESIPVAQESLAVVRDGMRQAVTEGSARLLSDMSIPLAGKTGTAQVGGIDETHAWFTGYGPVTDPELVLTVLIERGGDGDRVAVPIARKAWQWWLEHRQDVP